jgi:NADH-quinone oxidoreductase subunit C
VTPAQAVSVTRERLGVEPTVDGRFLTVALTTEQWEPFARLARHEIGCLYFNWLSAIDWKADGLEVVCRVENVDTGLAVMMRTKLPAGQLHCPSVVAVWKGADWMERECYDMFGVTFDGHPDLRRILLGQDWVGYPLRKDWVDTGYLPYR